MTDDDPGEVRDPGSVTETRSFLTADILSATTPYLLSSRRMEGLCELVDWMTFSAPTPERIDLKVWSGFKMRADLARRSLLRQHPQLAGASPAPGLDEADLIAWLLAQEQLFGFELVVARAEVEMREAFDAVAQAMTPAVEFMRSAAENLAGALQPLAQSMTQLANTFQAGVDRDLSGHPDVAEMDAALDGFYGSGPGD